MVMNDNAQVSSMSQKLVCIFLVGHQRTPDTDTGMNLQLGEKGWWAGMPLRAGPVQKNSKK
jgi:hypothetical protein